MNKRKRKKAMKKILSQIKFTTDYVSFSSTADFKGIRVVTYFGPEPVRIYLDEDSE